MLDLLQKHYCFSNFKTFQITTNLQVQNMSTMILNSLFPFKKKLFVRTSKNSGLECTNEMICTYVSDIDIWENKMLSCLYQYNLYSG